MMHPDIRANRNLLDFAKEEFLKRCERDPNENLERALELSGFKLGTIFANVPFPDKYNLLVDEYEQKIADKKIEDYVLIPAW